MGETFLQKHSLHLRLLHMLSDKTDAMFYGGMFFFRICHVFDCLIC